MPVWIKRLRDEYLETRLHPGEDFLYWFIQRKMTWGQRWIVVLILNFIVQPLIWNVSLIVWIFWFSFFLLVFYILGQLFFLGKSLYQSFINK